MLMTNYYEEKILNVFKGVSATAPANMYLGLLTVLPTGNSDGTEISYSGYARQRVTFDAPSKNSELYGTGKVGTKNSANIRFPEASVNVGNVVGVGVYDSLSGGNLYLYVPNAEALPVGAGQQPEIQAGNITLWSDGNFSEDFAKQMINLLRGNTITGLPAYIGLSYQGTELTGDNYSRKKITFGDIAQGSNNQATMKNNSVVEFNIPTTSWGLWDGVIIGNTDDIYMISPLLDVSGQPMTLTLKAGFYPYVNPENITITVN